MSRWRSGVAKEHAPTLYKANYTASSLHGVVGEYALASTCDRHVISTHSGLGLQAIFLGTRPVRHEHVRMLPDCTNTTVERLAESWSKI